MNEFWPGVKVLAGLADVDAAWAEKVRKGGCPHCSGVLDLASYPRKARPELGAAAAAYERRISFCCRTEGCRRRATPPSLRFLGRKVYVSVVVILASISGQGVAREGGRAGGFYGVPARTVRRWLTWWQTVFALSGFWAEATSFFRDARGGRGATHIVAEPLR